jgi:hypothetical protein
LGAGGPAIAGTAARRLDRRGRQTWFHASA